MSKKRDVESGERILYPTILENPELRLSFIRKVYSILTFQLLLTIVITSIVVFVRPIANFFINTAEGYALYHVLRITPWITFYPLIYYNDKHTLNHFLLFQFFTVTSSFTIGLTCAFVSGKVILEAVILTNVVVLSLTLYTSWAAKRCYDFSFLAPFLIGALLVHILFNLIKVWFLLDKLSHIIHGCFASIAFCGCIVYHTYKIIKRFSYDRSISSSVLLYLEIICFFLYLVTTILIFGAAA
ncbi:inhibitor of apoptosis-promoting Bax1 protein [Medicago truncatula]|uniref:Inhibitor of apoptosis-promoting Bax1 protein n=1 Tax=Medicago truncatula TaxID=3880 RepID=A0A072U290_MEDTR|nr:inhibitor of apoptosis-promoting Bax1 protein [Medicago truncatula]